MNPAGDSSRAEGHDLLMVHVRYCHPCSCRELAWPEMEGLAWESRSPEPDPDPPTLLIHPERDLPHADSQSL